MPRNYSPQTLKILWGRSGNRCAKPGCNEKLIVDATHVDPEAVIGHIAHIVASSSSGPRGDPSFPPDQLDKPDNLLLLCRNHHGVVDAQDSTYTIEELRRWKAEHEAWVDAELEAAVTTVTFVELEAVAAAVAAAPIPDDADLTLHPVREKMSRNGLTPKVEAELKVGLLGAGVVQEYIEAVASVDHEFPDRLRTGFVDEYNRLLNEGARGDDLYMELVQFASTANPDFRRQAAGRAVLAHLFQVCDVFET